MKLKGDIFMDWRNLGRPCHIDGGGRGLLESLYYEMGSRGEILRGKKNRFMMEPE